MEIDLNADVGESFGVWVMGEDEALIPLCSSVSVACGFHAGDPATIARTVGLAAAAGAAIGAHPAYPDLAGFGRRAMALQLPELEATILYQVGALQVFARAARTELRHVKPHGALYHQASVDPGVAEAISTAVRKASRDLAVVGMAGSVLLQAAEAAGLQAVGEAFPDRGYRPDGTLLPRREPGALVHDPDAVARRALELALHHRVNASNGATLQVEPATLCIHGDTPGAAARAQAVRSALEAAGVRLAAPGR